MSEKIQCYIRDDEAEQLRQIADAWGMKVSAATSTLITLALHGRSKQLEAFTADVKEVDGGER